jgi:2-amino-4-hydroxy-6-hydroxymethyldihydropteridine diphosphokinase
MPKLIKAYIALGANLGDREKIIEKSLKLLARAPGIESVKVSEAIETVPLSQIDQPNYLNAVAEIKTSLNAEELFAVTSGIETELGRQRGEKWAPRTIDLDILLFGDEKIDTPDLTIPHRQMHLRSFVLGPLCELNRKIVHPKLGVTVAELYERLRGHDFSIDPSIPKLVSIAGIIGVGKTTLAEKLTDALKGCTIYEPYDNNPFLPQVYAGKTELALASELFFLRGRADQLKRNKLCKKEINISDYVFENGLIFARRLLDAKQLEAYENDYPEMAENVTGPGLAIHLVDSADKCLERIHKRNRPYEQEIEKQFLENFSADYDKLFSGWAKCPVIRIDASKFDIMVDDNIQALARQIRSYVEV